MLSEKIPWWLDHADSEQERNKVDAALAAL